MDYRILGPLIVSRDGGPVTLGTRRSRELLSLLLLRANEVVSSDRLIEDLWRGPAPDNARKALQVYVSRLRKTLVDDVLETRAPGYVLRVEEGEFDVWRFEHLAAQGRRALAAGDPARAATSSRHALALWRGPALADVMYEPFAQAEAARLEELRLCCVEARIDADLALGRHADLVGELEALIDQHGARERLRGQLMVALYRSGRQAEALNVYRQTRRRLLDELGLEPGPDLRRSRPRSSLMIPGSHGHRREPRRPTFADRTACSLDASPSWLGSWRPSRTFSGAAARSSCCAASPGSARRG
jgi:DNA-binding SARP family transcriptional activator